ncbi:hypothetical protein E2542_SST28988 [Spatholobus suberectus]|nr:hypothetical protein E2542_SST28988 [Spatholobus suberectus]
MRTIFQSESCSFGHDGAVLQPQQNLKNAVLSTTAISNAEYKNVQVYYSVHPPGHHCSQLCNLFPRSVKPTTPLIDAPLAFSKLLTTSSGMPLKVKMMSFGAIDKRNWEKEMKILAGCMQEWINTAPSLSLLCV